LERNEKTLKTHLPERQLWSLFLSGDQRSLSKIADIHYRSLYNYGYRFSADEEFVKDCIQELFLELWERRGNLSEVEAVKSYLLTAFRHKLINEARRFRRFKMHDIPFLSESMENPVESQIIENDLLNEQSGRLKLIITQLTARQQEIIYLRFYQGLEYAEITQIMALERQSVANLLHRSLKEIKEKWLSPDLLLKFLYFIIANKQLHINML
jgi:RNA polymerase sigma factor (sigma-70 family)